MTFFLLLKFFLIMGQAESQYKDLELSEIQSLYRTFIMECPSGSLHLHEFKKIFGVKSGPNAASMYLENIFRSFDENGVSGLSSRWNIVIFVQL